MKIFKFGGASVKDANAIVNVANILKKYPHQKLTVVISAMGKTTNALESVWKFHRNSEPIEAEKQLTEIYDSHFKILQHLNINSTENEQKVRFWFEKVLKIIAEPKIEDENFDYDQIVSIGEMISTVIVSAYLNSIGLNNTWLDAGNIIRTNNNYREGNVDWLKSEHLASELKHLFLENTETNLLITQGFLGKTPENFYCTLGREGSDFTGAILAYLFNAESLTIWKDVPAMLNADPKFFNNTVKLNKVPYREAIELAYYGASVIHPKTIKPLQNKKIPLFVKSFENPNLEGTEISSVEKLIPMVPCYIVKQNQTLISISPNDFSFMVEHNLRDVFNLLHSMGIKVNLMQNSAVSFSICVDSSDKVSAFINTLKSNFRVLYNIELQLLTIRHYDENTLNQLTRNKEVLVEQKNRQTVRLIIR